MRLSIFVPVATIAVLAAGTACARTSDTVAASTPSVSTVLTPTAAPATSQAAAPATSRPAAPSWPTPQDCVSYDPAALTVHYEAGIYAILDGSTVVMQVSGPPGDDTGDKGLALAQRYRKHCFLGRNNTRAERNAYIFDYWRSESGLKPTIAGQDEDCSPYDRTDLTVEDMGGGNGWRVKENDHVLHLFDNESDARNGKLVLSKYRQICLIGNRDEDDPKLVSYFR